LKNNRITEKGAKTIISNLNKNLKVLDFSDNNIGNKGSETLYSFLI
jgi:hypothetical protein